MKTLVEWYLGIEPTGSGESARWTLSWGGGEFSIGWLTAVLSSAAVLVAVVARREAAGGSARWLRLCALRTSALMIVGVWLGALTLNVVRTGLPSVVLLVDTSASMGLEDDHAASGATPGGADNAAPGARLAIAKEWLLREEASLFRELARRYRLQVYEFSDEPRLIGQSTTAEQLNAAVQAISNLEPDGNETRPGPCLDRVLAEYRGAPPAAVVVISDGIASLSTREKLSSARLPGSLVVPLYTIPMGSSAAAIDLEVYDLRVDPIVFVGDTVSADVTTRGVGLAGRQASYELHLTGRSSAIDHATITIPEDGQPTSVRLSFTPEYEGDHELIVAAEPHAEERNRDNNVLRRRIHVRQGQFRVLLIERAPRWEYRHLKAVLERDPNIELRTVLQESDLDHQREDRTALSGFPATRADLFAYDAVILGDIDLQYLNPGALDLVREFVATRGGGLILIAGESNNPSAFRGTPLESLIPVELTDEVAEPRSTPFRILPARVGLDHPLLRISDESRTTEFWQRLPTLNWSVKARARAPGGVLIATSGQDDVREAMIAVQRFGAGLVLFHATDELWRWRKRVEDRYYGRYWRQAVRFVCRADRLGQSGQSELTTDRTAYQHGDSVRFRLRTFDPSIWDVDDEGPALSVERDGGATLRVLLSETSEVADEFTGVLPSVVRGAYVARLTKPNSTEIAAECRFLVNPPQRELLQHAADIQDLQRAARATQGAALEYDEVATLPSRLPQGETTAVLSSEKFAIWARGEWLLLFVGLLSAEWLLRRSS